MKKDFCNICVLCDAILLGNDLSVETVDAFFSSAIAFLNKYSNSYYCSEVEFFTERVNKKLNPFI